MLHDFSSEVGVCTWKVAEIVDRVTENLCSFKEVTSRLRLIVRICEVWFVGPARTVEWLGCLGDMMSLDQSPSRLEPSVRGP